MRFLILFSLLLASTFAAHLHAVKREDSGPEVCLKREPFWDDPCFKSDLIEWCIADVLVNETVKNDVRTYKCPGTSKYVTMNLDDGWESAADCWKYCQGCIREALVQKAPSARCYRVAPWDQLRWDNTFWNVHNRPTCRVQYGSNALDPGNGEPSQPPSTSVCFGEELSAGMTEELQEPMEQQFVEENPPDVELVEEAPEVAGTAEQEMLQ